MDFEEIESAGEYKSANYAKHFCFTQIPLKLSFGIEGLNYFQEKSYFQDDSATGSLHAVCGISFWNIWRSQSLVVIMFMNIYFEIVREIHAKSETFLVLFAQSSCWSHVIMMDTPSLFLLKPLC